MAEPEDSPYLPALDFRPADLAANRRGELSVDQQARLEGFADKRRRWSRTTAAWSAIGVVALLVAGIVIESGGDDPPGAGFAMVAFVGLCLFFAGAVLVSYRAGLAKPHGIFTVQAAEGTAEPKVIRRRSRTGFYYTYELHLHGGTGRSRFVLADQATLDHFLAGERYRVYWVSERPWPIVLSFETVADGGAGGAVPWGGSGGGR